MTTTSRTLTLALLLAALFGISGCAYRYYLGMHGPSIRSSPEIHEASVREDAQCLACHGPAGAGDAPQTTHPHFRGCLKCHSDRQ